MPPLTSWADAEAALDIDPARSALWRARSTMAASLAYAIRHLPADHTPPRERRWCAWIVGARDAMEGVLAREGHLAEVLCKLCPIAKGWEVVLIGPEMDERAPAERDNCHVRSVRGTLHQLRADGRLDDGGPDFVVLYNSGIGTLNLPIVEPWLPSCAFLLALDVPLLLTCFHDGESNGEQEVLVQQFGARVLLAPRDNPLAHAIPVDCLARRDEAGEAECARELVEFAAVAARAYADKRARDAKTLGAANAAGSATGSGASLASAHYAQLNDVAGLETANSRMCWLRGSRLSGRALEVDAPRATRRLLRELCAAFSVSRLPQWLAGLATRSNSRAEERLEGRAMDAVMLAESCKRGAIATRALELGAMQTLAQALDDAVAAGYTRRGDGAGGGAEDDDEAEEMAAEAAEISGAGCDTSSYTGVLGATRLGTACEKAIARLHATAAAVEALKHVPAEPMVLLQQPIMWQVAFKGEYVHVRAAPSVASASCGQLAREATFVADATRGPWVRLAVSERLAGGWALTDHPVHGALLVR